MNRNGTVEIVRMRNDPEPAEPILDPGESFACRNAKAPDDFCGERRHDRRPFGSRGARINRDTRFRGSHYGYAPVATGFIAAIMAVGCGSNEVATGADYTAVTARFEELFDEVDRIVLEEPGLEVISRLPHRAIDVDADGRIALADPAQMRIRMFTPDGELVRVLGRIGDAPGEYREMITGLAFIDSGGLWAVDGGNRRLTRYTPDFEVDTITPHPEALINVSLKILPDQRLLYNARPSRPRALFDILSPNGTELVASFHNDPDLWDVPYWRSVAEQHVALLDDRIIVANSLTFPLYVYTLEGDSVGTFGTAPATWRQASRPDRGAFGPETMGDFDDWFRSFTRIGDMHTVGDSLLLVSIGTVRPEETRYYEYSYVADIYNRAGIKLYTDVALPGRAIFALDDLYLVLSEPPDGPWTIGRFAVRHGRASE